MLMMMMNLRLLRSLSAFTFQSFCLLPLLLCEHFLGEMYGSFSLKWFLCRWCYLYFSIYVFAHFLLTCHLHLSFISKYLLICERLYIRCSIHDVFSIRFSNVTPTRVGLTHVGGAGILLSGDIWMYMLGVLSGKSGLSRLIIMWVGFVCA